ncbi:MAG: tRNA (N6-threonylcarbamoyladenosine(37)-N6)-methyltransferase TrmO [bacterium]|nr:tRNA (N6-threonylcarbamoyladenosine(37)-N6)-methyltransferase TrmO [bacterium]MDD3624113.1 tRNA (N6-threonylcarbamoyladenosine(37)-N6)-methyltransferase TrmO [Proteiniphilum sp.]MDD3967705.1 tRNA (N6-threonylcarbamoyladenosine(37)-N6)-methyltransferase TrmO [Proteiniphilum sp.]MDD4458950.1 tRNA (N6-threonylcarbamoyladenosine(37)-N6)-methyltransferase TrmO [Proteiniphilum sp.]
MKPVARIRTDFPTKFGIPRQSGMVNELKGKVLFEPGFRNPDALRGLNEYSHIWLIWEFSASKQEGWSPTVRPPRLGGNKRMGLFATRSPFRPNPIGLSSVRLERIEWHTDEGPVLHVAGVDLMDGTPILDIKPYIPYTDSHAEASGGFTDDIVTTPLGVVIPAELLGKVFPAKLQALREVLANDPRPSYQGDPDRVYGFTFAGQDVRFTVSDGVLTVVEVVD